MAVDRIFWEIVGLSAHNKDTLSFRNRRLWTLRPPNHIEHIGNHIASEKELAKLAVDWTHEWCQANTHRLTLANMAERLGPERHFSDDDRILAICLSVLADDFQTAHRLATYQPSIYAPLTAYQSDYGFISQNGQSPTLIEKARAWLVSKRRKALKLAL